MKRLILLLMVAVLVNVCKAQDVIVKNDGTTVVAKVLEVTDLEVSYKKWSNQDGPIYRIKKTEIKSVNYSNGEVESFSVTEKSKLVEESPDYNLEQLGHDVKELGYDVNRTIAESHNATGWRIGGWLLTIPGAVSLFSGIFCLVEGNEAGTYLLPISACLIGGGWACFEQANEEESYYAAVQSHPFVKTDLSVGNNIISPSVNIIADNVDKKFYPAIGLSIGF